MPNWNSGGFSPISTYSGHLSFLQTVANGLRAVYPDPAVRRLATTKSISNDLNRLYRMQFLSRKRRKRQVVTAKGTICCKGFTYEYHLNKQGISYCEYLRRPKFDRDLQQKIRRKEITLKESFTYFIMKEAGEMIGPANGIALLKIAEYLSSYLSVQLFNRRFKRFPPPRDDELFFLMFTLLARNKGDKDSIKGLSNMCSFLLENVVFYQKGSDLAMSLVQEAISYAEEATQTAANPAGKENGVYWLREG